MNLTTTVEPRGRGERPPRSELESVGFPVIGGSERQLISLIVSRVTDSVHFFPSRESDVRLVFRIEFLLLYSRVYYGYLSE